MLLATRVVATSVLAAVLLSAPIAAQSFITSDKAIASAQTAYFADHCGVDAVGSKALEELTKWTRFRVVPDRSQADLLILLTTDPNAGGNLIFSGQTGSIDSQGHVQEDRVPTYNKLEAVKSAFLIVTDLRSGKQVWSSSRRWGGLLTGRNSVGEHLVKQFEEQVKSADERARLKLIKNVTPTYPAEAGLKNVEGTVVVGIVVDKNGAVSHAQSLSGPPELYRASEDAAKQVQFEPPERAPITTEVEMSYALGPKPCPPGQKGRRPVVEVSMRKPEKHHPEELKIMGEIDTGSPPYPQPAIDAGIEGELQLFITVAASGDVIGVRVVKPLEGLADQPAVDKVRTWRFKVSHGVPASYEVHVRYMLSCDALGSS